MSLIDTVKDQFLDVIEWEETNNKLIVYKYKRASGNNELKQNSKVIVREGQYAVFVKGGEIADILPPGTYSLNTDNMPVLSKLKAFPYLFVSPVISDLYFVNTKLFIDNKWSTKNPILKRDDDFSMVRIRSFGKYSFRIINVESFMIEIFGSRGIVMTYDIVQYLSSLVLETFATVIGETKMSILDLASKYRQLSNEILEKLNSGSEKFGVEFSNIIIENLSLPPEVEKLIDEQSGISMASKNMNTFVQYQTARAMRDASKQESGFAGLGAGVAIGQSMANNIQNFMQPSDVSNNNRGKVEQLRDLKALFDEGILTKEEFETEKRKILNI